MDSRPQTEKHCIFFLLTLLAGCAVVAILACEAIHLLFHMQNGAMFLAVGLLVAALVAGVTHFVHAARARHDDGSGQARIAH